MLMALHGARTENHCHKTKHKPQSEAIFQSTSTDCVNYTITTHPFNGLFSRTTWVSRYQKGKTSLDLNEARDDGIMGWQRHQLDRMQIICTLFQTDDHANTPSLNFSGRMLFPMPNQQYQSTEGTFNI